MDIGSMTGIFNPRVLKNPFVSPKCGSSPGEPRHPHLTLLGSVRRIVKDAGYPLDIGLFFTILHPFGRAGDPGGRLRNLEETWEKIGQVCEIGC